MCWRLHGRQLRDWCVHRNPRAKLGKRRWRGQSTQLLAARTHHTTLAPSCRRNQRVRQRPVPEWRHLLGLCRLFQLHLRGRLRGDALRDWCVPWPGGKADACSLARGVGLTRHSCGCQTSTSVRATLARTEQLARTRSMATPVPARLGTLAATVQAVRLSWVAACVLACALARAGDEQQHQGKPDLVLLFNLQTSTNARAVPATTAPPASTW